LRLISEEGVGAASKSKKFARFWNYGRPRR